MRRLATSALLVSAVLVVPARAAPAPAIAPHVVVATLDTGTNPFHPSFRRAQNRHPSTFIPGYPRAGRAAKLSFAADFADSVDASESALSSLGGANSPAWVPGTNIIGTWNHETDQKPIFDETSTQSHAHGASASSQIVGRGLGTAPDAWLVVMDRTADGGVSAYQANADGLRWAADQPWIDVIHTNIQNLVPLASPQTPGGFQGFPEAVRYALSKGKVVVSAGGNFYAEPTETSPHAGPAGVLVAGANDNCGFTSFSNPDPHVAMDGAGTVAAEPDGYETTTFGGTSSASPRITGYVADLLLRVRRHFGYRDGIRDGALVVLPAKARPKLGPLADGRLTAADVHEIVRKTARPLSHASKWDGAQDPDCVPDGGVLDSSVAYAKIGYGEVSEHTIGAAFDVAIGRKPMPARPMEDRYYDASERLRHQFWD